MLKTKSVFLFSILAGAIVLIFSKHIVRSAFFSLLSSFLAVVIGSVAGIALFILFLNYLEKKSYYGANFMSFNDFSCKFLTVPTNEVSNPIVRNQNFISRTKSWFSWISESAKLLIIKIVYRLVNSSLVKDHLESSSSPHGSLSGSSVYELIRPHGQTPEKMLMSAYGPAAISRSSSSVCVSPRIDEIMHKIFEYTYRDYVEIW